MGNTMSIILGSKFGVMFSGFLNRHLKLCFRSRDAAIPSKSSNNQDAVATSRLVPPISKSSPQTSTTLPATTISGRSNVLRVTSISKSSPHTPTTTPAPPTSSDINTTPARTENSLRTGTSSVHKPGRTSQPITTGTENSLLMSLPTELRFLIFSQLIWLPHAIILWKTKSLSRTLGILDSLAKTHPLLSLELSTWARIALTTYSHAPKQLPAIPKGPCRYEDNPDLGIFNPETTFLVLPKKSRYRKVIVEWQILMSPLFKRGSVPSCARYEYGNISANTTQDFPAPRRKSKAWIARLTKDFEDIMKDRKYWDKARFETIDLYYRAVIVKGLGETRHTR